nr:hypothetical protein [Tanacetum cinerariifolium]
HHAAAYPRAQDNAKHHLRLRKLLLDHAQPGFGQGKAVGIVGQHYRHAQQLFQVGAQRAAIKGGSVAVFVQPGARHGGAGRARPVAGRSRPGTGPIRRPCQTARFWSSQNRRSKSARHCWAWPLPAGGSAPWLWCDGLSNLEFCSGPVRCPCPRARRPSAPSSETSPAAAHPSPRPAPLSARRAAWCRWSGVVVDAFGHQARECGVEAFWLLSGPVFQPYYREFLAAVGLNVGLKQQLVDTAIAVGIERLTHHVLTGLVVFYQDIGRAKLLEQGTDFGSRDADGFSSAVEGQLVLHRHGDGGCGGCRGSEQASGQQQAQHGPQV